jgi:hypothetical protein
VDLRAESASDKTSNDRLREPTIRYCVSDDSFAPKAALSETALDFIDQRILGRLNIFGSKGYARC